jgi:hypothetical protein
VVPENIIPNFTNEGSIGPKTMSGNGYIGRSTTWLWMKGRDLYKRPSNLRRKHIN